MKWFMPPMPSLRSRMQAETQEPRTVVTSSSRRVTYSSPGLIFAAGMLRVLSQ